ncbi:MAG: hypothetical protein ACYS5F_14565, partial [Planctomycetota bacterium]
MKKQRHMMILIFGCILILAAEYSVCSADYSIDWYTIDGGGGTSSGGDFVLNGTIGQPDAAVMSGGGFELLSGFLPGGPVCMVNFEHYAMFANWWLVSGC